MNVAESNPAKFEEIFPQRRAEAIKSRLLEKAAAVSCAVCLAVGVMSGVVFAREEASSVEIASPEATFVVVDTASEEVDAQTVEITDNRNTVPLLVNGQETGACVVINGVPYVSVEDFCCALGAESIPLEVKAGRDYFVCNGRYFYMEGGIPTVGDQVCLPVEKMAKCLGVTATWDRVQWTISVEADGFTLLESGETYYNENDLYWLSRVIYAEAGNQSLEGQVGVGNVVMNRLADESFGDQNTVYDVIFAKNQFEVVINGMIYMEPSESAVIAAKLALEGCDVVSGATYFATHDFGEGYECVVWLGDHCFMSAA